MTAGRDSLTRSLVVLVTMGLLLSGFFVWSNAFAPRPIAAEASPSPIPVTTNATSPSPTSTPRTAWAIHGAGGGRELTVEWELPASLELVARAYDGYIAFASEGADGSFNGQDTDRGSGVRIVDATTARPHFNDGRPLGTDAASFVQGLATNERAGSPELGPVSAVLLGAVPALSVDLVGPDGDRVHLDAANVSIDLYAPSRLIVADFGTTIILVHIWARPGANFDTWAAQAQRLLESIRIEVAP